MANPVDDLKAAGFSEDEIGAWSMEKRSTLSGAGFKDNEIDAYFAGGPVVPNQVPKAMVERVAHGGEIGKAISGLSEAVTDVPREMWQTTVDNLKGVKDELLPTTLGGKREPATEGVIGGLGHTTSAALGILGLPFSPIQGAVRSLVGHPMVMADDFLRRGAAAIYGEDRVKGTEEAAGAQPGGLTYEAAKGRIDTALMALASARAMHRMEFGPTGEPVVTPVGGLPKSEDFVSAARTVAGGEAPAAVRDKLLALYQEHGIHPAEVAHDAVTDPTVAQSLLSSGGDLPARYIEAYHGSPHNFERFDASRIGTGEGAQSYGHGLYFAENPAVADSYAKPRTGGGTSSAGMTLADLEKGRNLYKVRINAEKEHFLDWDKPLDEQSEFVRNALLNHSDPMIAGTAAKWGHDIPTMYSRIAQRLGGEQELGPEGKRYPVQYSSEEKASAALREAGIPGITYLDQGSRDKGDGTHNFVVFDDKHVEITHKNGEPVTPQERTDYLAGRMGGEGGKPPPPPDGSSVGAPAPKPPAGSLAEAEQKVLDKISVGGRDAERKLTLDQLYRHAVDDLHPIKGVSEDAYKLARLTRGQFGKAQQFLEHGTFDFKSYADNGRSFRDIVEPVRDDLDGLRAYLASKRALDIEASGRKSGIDLEAAQKVVTGGAGRYEAIAAQLGEYQTNLLKYLRDSGMLSQAAFDAMQAANKNYVPFYRVMEEWRRGQEKGSGKSFGPGNPIKALKGSERDIVDPLESIVKNTYAYVSIAERNAVGIKLIDVLKAEAKTGEALVETAASKPRATDARAAADLAEAGIKDAPPELVDVLHAAAAPEQGNTISAFRNGVKETVKITDRDLLEAFRGLGQHEADMLVKILAVPARTLRAGAVLTPEFMAKNLTRDFLTAFINSKGIFTPLDTARGLKSVIAKDADFQNWLKSGGANSTMVSLDRHYLQESLQKLTADTGLMDRAWNVVKSPLAGLRMASELIENATRLGEFKKVIGDSTAKADIQAAGFAAREVTLDFARIGASMRAYNMITAFANAQIQGVDRMARAFKDNPTSTSLKVAGGITLPSVLLWYANHDDPRYKELPQWQRDLFWVVMTKDHIYRIPKPFEVGVIFGSGVERILDHFFGENPDAFKGFAGSVWSALMPSAIPTAALPMLEQGENRSSFTDRTLIPHDMEKHLPEYQYTPYTTELSKALGQTIAAFPGVRSASLEENKLGAVARGATSPILIENYVRGWTGGLGNYMLNAADAGLRKAGVLPDPVKPSPTLSDIPFVRAFVVRYPSAGAQSIQDFYDKFDQNKRFYDTWLARAKEGDGVALSRIQEAGGPQMFVQLDGIKQTLSEHSQLVRDIYKNPTIQAEEKRQLIDQLYYSMIEVGKHGKAMLKQVEAATEPGAAVH